MNHEPRRRVAPATPTPVDLSQPIAFVATRLLFGIRDVLCPKDRQFLKDLARRERRYPMRSLTRLVAIAQLAVRDEDAEALAEQLRAVIVAGRKPNVSLDVALEWESLAQGPCDVAAYRYKSAPTAGTRQDLIDSLSRQLTATRVALDAVYATPVPA